MSFLYLFSDKLRLVYLAGFYRCTSDEILNTSSQLVKNIQIHPIPFCVCDFRATVNLDIDFADFQRILALIHSFVVNTHATTKLALLIRHDLDAPLMKVFTFKLAALTHLEIRDFYSLKPALSWMGLSEFEDEVNVMRQSLQQQATKEANR